VTYQRRTPLVEFDPAKHTITRVGPVGPVAVFTGPLVFSVGGVLDLIPRWIWDVNGYYEALCVSPQARRIDLLRAYVAADGASSVRLTMILRLLLNPKVRWLYDCSAPGEVFVDDEVLAAMSKARHKANLGQASTDPPAPMAGAADGEELPDREEQGQVDLTWQWGYFLWSSYPDDEALREWQACLCRVYAATQTNLAVGLSASGEDAFVYHHGAYKIAFLKKGVTPTDSLAATLHHVLSTHS
jgi:hypothetical protein